MNGVYAPLVFCFLNVRVSTSGKNSAHAVSRPAPPKKKERSNSYGSNERFPMMAKATPVIAKATHMMASATHMIAEKSDSFDIESYSNDSQKLLRL